MNTSQRNGLNIGKLRLLLLTTLWGLAIASTLSSNISLAQPTANQLQRYQIPAGPLSSTLNQFAAQAGILLSANAELTAGKKSAGLNGEYAVNEALNIILQGSDLRWRYSAPNTVTLEKIPQQAGSTSLNAITITGELQARTLQDTQTSVAAFTGEQLDKSTDFSLYDTVERAPNVVNAFGNKGFTIRGISQNGAGGGAGNGRTIDISVDGASAPTTQSTFFGAYSTWDIQQVELLRGPQSTQQGRNALAGSINIRSADPSFEEESKLRFRAGQQSTSQIALMHNQPISDDMAFRIAAETTHTDGWVSNPTRNEDDYDARDTNLFRAKLLLEPTDQLRMIVKHSYNKNSGGEDYINYSLFPEQRVNFSDHPAEEVGRHHITGLDLDYAMNDNWSLLSETIYYTHDYHRLEDNDATASAGNYVDRTLEDTSIAEELKFVYNNDEDLSAAIGIYLTNIKSVTDDLFIADANTVSSLIPPGVAVFRREIERENRTKNFAVFGEVDYDITSTWTLTAGARYDYEKLEVSDSTKYFLTPPVTALPPDDAIQTGTSYNAFLPKLGATYHWTEKTSTSFTIQRGYRAGGNDRNPFTLAVSDYDPEYTWNYEIAWRSLLLNDRLAFNANLFYTDWRDQQVRIFGPSGNTNDRFTVNAGRSTIYGAEMDINYKATSKLDTYLALGYAKTEFKEFVSGGVNYAGNEFAFAPKFTAALGGTYHFVPEWFIQLDGNYTDEFFGDVNNRESEKVDKRFLVNARFGYENDQWAANIFVRNLTDKDYVTQIFEDSSRGLIARTGEPRVIGVEFTANW